ncbi:hypothetical protein SERLA73DRAFT_188571 [Serpula lacrymans var. lacrymans S7.3]|uniref:Aminoglycoside phosphotransferase domain-containing protein n=2 Tax=Serpula lacrymans var. lacrymans TaxID=341189 RepID=F8QBL4_SERL3|nr:uncharacterized protein SERLADRAFT_478731 [Serpula lacrymans var. lacrymans S7.9]EGN94600.1 hypothetical protein SERLA73DRAFT_188571 [Serpula lacrymans var. lacrymans S7.3]EGO20077.1 hypothetical protein SERLADRAFT_478731 [Serpula lacrymans var. lacrymans S7.9]
MNSPLFPYMTSFHLSNGDIQLKYRYRLHPQNSDKIVFMASTHIPGEDHEVDVVVKFTDTYCIEAHALLAKDGLAPKLFYWGKPNEVAMYVVVIELVKGESATGVVGGLSATAISALAKAVQLLHGLFLESCEAPM